MAKATHCSITRRAVVAGSAAAVAAVLPGGAMASSGADPAPDPIHAAIAAHARAYAAYQAQRKAEPEEEIAREPLIEIERAAAEALAATVPATLQGVAAALAYVRLLHARDNYPLLDDYGCYELIASVDTALRHALASKASGM